MGTLFNQSPRYKSLRAVDQLVNDMFGEKDLYSPEEWRAAIELAKYNLALQSADVLDEQLAGFGEILERFVETQRKEQEQ